MISVDVRNLALFQGRLARIVRGLYWIETSTPLGTEPEIGVFPAYSLDISEARCFKELMDVLPPKSLNKGTFVYKWVLDEDGTSIWGMQFFKRHTVFAIAEARKT